MYSMLPSPSEPTRQFAKSSPSHDEVSRRWRRYQVDQTAGWSFQVATTSLLRCCQTHEVSFANDSYGLTLPKQFLSFSVLAALFMTSQFLNVLIANVKHCCMLCDT